MLVAHNFDPGTSPITTFTYNLVSPFTPLVDGILEGLVVTVATTGSSTNPKLGDFWFLDSTLSVDFTKAAPTANDPASTVPEPGTLLLLGAGLAGLRIGAARRSSTGK